MGQIKLYRLLFLLASLGVLTNCNKASSIKVILMAGQSNMEGHDAHWNTLDETIIKTYRNGHKNVKINYNCTYEKTYEQGVANTSNGEFVDVDFGQGRNKDLLGPEVGISKYLGEHDHNQRYYLIKSCEGSSSLAEQWAETGSCWKTFVDDVNASILKLQERKCDFKIVGVMWMQGEFDARNEDEANHYKERTFDLINRINNAFSKYIPSCGVSFIDAGISTDGIWAFSEKVNRAKKEVAASNINYRYVMDSEILEKTAPNAPHYSAQSYLTLGERFAEEYLDIKQ